MDHIKEILMAEARDKGICLNGYKEMRSDDIDGLIGYYITNPDWCLERDFPTLSFLRKHFADCGNVGVYVDQVFKGEYLNDLQTYIFHNCKGTIKVGLNVEKCMIPMLYLANGCRLRIIGTGNRPPAKSSDRTIVPIYTFGKNDVSARDNKYVVFNKYKNELI